MKQILCLLLALTLLCRCASAEPAENGEYEPHKISSKETRMYLMSLENSLTLNVYFVDGAKDLPWIDLEAWSEVLTILQQDIYANKDYQTSFSADGDIATITRENGYYMRADFQDKTLYFNDYNGFLHDPGDISPLLDLVSEPGFNADGEPELFKRMTDASFDRCGDAVLLDLGAYGIDMIRYEDCYLVPLQTLGDFTLARPLLVDTFFNGREIFLANERYLTRKNFGYTELGERYYSSMPTDRSDALAQYGYSELCLVLDKLYGLKQPHDIDDFAQIFWQIGLDEPLQSVSASDADTALYAFLDYYLDDVHTYFDGFSWMTGKEKTAGMTGTASASMNRQVARYLAARTAALGGEYDQYLEVGNTAYITFDHFENESAGNYYEKVKQGIVPQDTIGLIIYAHNRIYRDDSPIENVVIDLSNNTGGSVNAAVFTVAWFLGEATLSVKDTFTGALSTAVYRADVNLNREFNDGDTVSEKKLYCLVSPVSFSCANLVAAAFKASDRVTLLGRPTSGGSCTVLFLSSAWGAYFDISGPNRMSFQKNGSFYDIDQGVEPDFIISKIENFYDREALTEYINKLF